MDWCLYEWIFLGSLTCSSDISGGPQAKASFYHMDWPYALASQQPQQRQKQLLLAAAATADEGAATAAKVCPAISEADRKAAGCLYTSIWRRLRAGRLKAAETLAAAKGASWLVEVLRGKLPAAVAAGSVAVKLGAAAATAVAAAAAVAAAFLCAFA